MNLWYKKFSSQPHQPFFASGILFFAIFMALFFFAYSNKLILDSSILTYHAYSLVFVVFIQFFLGFLFVVFPKFLMQPEILVKDYMKQFYYYFFSTLAIFITIIFFSKLTIFAQFALFVAQILSFKLLLSIHKKSIIKDKNDTKWVLIAFATGLFFHFLYIVSFLDFSFSHNLSKFAINGGFYLFLFMIVFTISQRMIPYFTKVITPSYIPNKSAKLLDYLFVLLILKVVALSFENTIFSLVVDSAIFIFVTKELIKWRLPLFKVPAIVWILYLGLYWIVIAFFISIIENIVLLLGMNFYFEKIVIHTLAIGYFVTVLIGFGTRVVLGHSGRKIETGKFALMVFIAVEILTLVRMFASISSNFNLDYIFFIELSTILLLVALSVWSSKYLLILLENEKKSPPQTKWRT